MPQIPTYIANVSLGRQPTPSIPTAPVGAGFQALGQGLESFGSALGQYGKEERRAQEAADASEAHNRFIEDLLTFHEAEKLNPNSLADPKRFRESVMEHARQSAKAIADELTDPLTSNHFRQLANHSLTQFAAHLIPESAAMVVENTKSTLEKGANLWRQNALTYTDPQHAYNDAMLQLQEPATTLGRLGESKFKRGLALTMLVDQAVPEVRAGAMDEARAKLSRGIYDEGTGETFRLGPEEVEKQLDTMIQASNSAEAVRVKQEAAKRDATTGTLFNLAYSGIDITEQINRYSQPGSNPLLSASEIHTLHTTMRLIKAGPEKSNPYLLAALRSRIVQGGIVNHQDVFGALAIQGLTGADAEQLIVASQAEQNRLKDDRYKRYKEALSTGSQFVAGTLTQWGMNDFDKVGHQIKARMVDYFETEVQNRINAAIDGKKPLTLGEIQALAEEYTARGMEQAVAMNVLNLNDTLVNNLLGLYPTKESIAQALIDGKIGDLEFQEMSKYWQYVEGLQKAQSYKERLKARAEAPGLAIERGGQAPGNEENFGPEDYKK